ncbi:MAG: DUF1559 domain-containing protein [Armatimonadota bacterium]
MTGSAHTSCCAPMAWPGQRALTVVELLVAIALIGLLAGILLPVLSRARETGRRSRCISNVKQIVAAVHMYETDWAQVPTFSGLMARGFADGRLAPYGADGDVLICPSDDGEPEGGLGPYDCGSTSYSYLLTDGLLLENQAQPPYHFAPASPVVVCDNHAERWRNWVVGRYDGSVDVTTGYVDAAPELEGIGKLYAKP